jgi:hypothetical protein
LFVTHPVSFQSGVTGGVQLCTREFFDMLVRAGLETIPHFVPYTKKITDRALLRFKVDVYNMFDITGSAPELLNKIEQEKASWVFLNMAGTVRFSKSIKERFGTRVKVVLLSHGNDSGDFLRVASVPVRPSLFRRLQDTCRLGKILKTESYFRIKYLDAVITVSETERQIENWFGAKKVIFAPRLLTAEPLDWKPVAGRAGFVGRLDHPPNYGGVTLLFDELAKKNISGVEIRIVGAPAEWGKRLEKKYSFVKYRGELSDEELTQEVSTWALFLNPVFWYSTGVTTKVAKAVAWGLPLLTTTAGLRGYTWKEGTPAIADSPLAMAEILIRIVSSLEHSRTAASETIKMINTAPTAEEISKQIREELDKIQIPL